VSIRATFTLRADWPDELRRMFPRITVSQIEAFEWLRANDNLIDDTGEPTEAFIRWCGGVAQ